MPDWDTRLEIKVGNTTIAPITQFAPQFNVPHTVIHSIEADNVGYVRQPITFTFTMTVQAIGTVVAELTQMALNGDEFEIAVSERSGTDWTFSAIKFKRCRFNSTSPSTITADGAPQASFNCTALLAEPE